MKTYKVNADFHVNVEVVVEARDEEDAIRRAKLEILSKTADVVYRDPIGITFINWVEDIDSGETFCPICRSSDCSCGDDYYND